MCVCVFVCPPFTSPWHTCGNKLISGKERDGDEQRIWSMLWLLCMVHQERRSRAKIVYPVCIFFYKCQLTFPSRLSCCISCSLLPIPMKAHGWASCSVQPSFSILSSFFCQPLPIRYTHGGGQKNLNRHKRGFQCMEAFLHQNTHKMLF